jgi:hypothetical protein
MVSLLIQAQEDKEKRGAIVHDQRKREFCWSDQCKNLVMIQIDVER